MSAAFKLDCRTCLWSASFSAVVVWFVCVLAVINCACMLYCLFVFVCLLMCVSLCLFVCGGFVFAQFNKIVVFRALCVDFCCGCVCLSDAVDLFWFVFVLPACLFVVCLFCVFCLFDVFVCLLRLCVCCLFNLIVVLVCGLHCFLLLLYYLFLFLLLSILLVCCVACLLLFAC